LSSPTRVLMALGSPPHQFACPQSPVKNSLPVPGVLLSGSGSQDNDDDAETSSPDDDCSVTQESRSRTGSGLGRGDGSAQASQSIASTRISSAEATGMRRMINVTPISIPPSSAMTLCGSGTPTALGGANVVFLGSPNRIPQNGLNSPHQWRPSTPSTPRGSNNGWDSGSTSSSASRDSSACQESDEMNRVEELMRCRAVSAGASFHPQMKKQSTACVIIGVKKSVVPTTKQASSPIKESVTKESREESLLCSPHNQTVSVTSTEIRVIASPTFSDSQLPSLAFFSTSH